MDCESPKLEEAVLISLFSSGRTEINVGTKLRLPQTPEDWAYVEFRIGYDWQFLPVDEQSDLRELIVVVSKTTFVHGLSPRLILGLCSQERTLWL